MLKNTVNEFTTDTRQITRQKIIEIIEEHTIIMKKSFKK